MSSGTLGIRVALLTGVPRQFKSNIKSKEISPMRTKTKIKAGIATWGT